MSFDKNNIDEYLKDFADEYKKLGGKENPLIIILVGGASVLLNYNFRKTTNDLDYLNPLLPNVKEAIEKTAEKYKIDKKWLNNELRLSASYKDILNDVSIFNKKISDVLEIRTVTSEYLIAMKLLAAREHKHDLSDVAGILRESYENNRPIKRKDIEKAIISLYGGIDKLPKQSFEFLNNVFINNDFQKNYLYLNKKEENTRKEIKNIQKDISGKVAHLNHREIVKAAIQKTNEKFEKYDSSKFVDKEAELKAREIKVTEKGPCIKNSGEIV
jgi:dGTP triphosphohydrolase